MADVRVELDSGGETSVFAVRVSEGASETRHRVSLGEGEMFRLGSGYPSEADFVRACFEFLLEREPKEQILERFEISDISRYFPEFPEEIRRRSPGRE